MCWGRTRLRSKNFGQWLVCRLPVWLAVIPIFGAVESFVPDWPDRWNGVSLGVLVADDNAVNSKVVTSLLSRLGHGEEVAVNYDSRRLAANFSRNFFTFGSTTKRQYDSFTCVR